MASDNLKKAKKRVKEKKKFREHLNSFITTNAIMLGMGLFFGFFDAWIMVTFFWGIGLAFHFFEAHNIKGLKTDERWEEEELEKEMRRLEGRKEVREDELDIDMDDHLDLNAPRPIPNRKYNDEDFV